MTTEEIVNILAEQGAFGVGHSGRTLADHLLNTYEILKSWNQPEYVCVAGAFHSVYGTNVFKNGIINPENRQKVVDVIGKEAEHLVYLFHICNRPNNIETGELKNRFTNMPLDIGYTALDLLDLRHIEAANMKEQRCTLLPWPTIHSIWERYETNSGR